MSLLGTTLGPSGWGAYRVDGTGFERLPDDPELPLLSPGFVDVHIHGAFGVDFVTASRSEYGSALDALAAVGYESLLPTTVTAPVVDVDRFRAELPDHPMIAGFYLEGPFLSPKHPGAQPKDAIVDPPDWPSDWDATLDDPRLRLVTLAPERPGADRLVRRLSARGVRASMGHTDATFEEAAMSGVVHATHTFNAMRPFHHREAGSVGYVLTDDAVDAELIYDRVHVSRDSARLLVKAKPAERIVAVSDATKAAGLSPGTRMTMWGLDVVVDPSSVRLLDGTLAGSSITLLDAFRNLREDFGAELAIRATSVNPRRALGLTAIPRRWTRWHGDEFEVVSLSGG